jgi:predicted permease
MSGIIKDLLHALRLLRQAPGFAAAAVATLALGIGANTVIFTAVESFLLRPLPLKDPDRLVVLHQTAPTTRQPSSVAWPDYQDWRAATDVFQDSAALQIETFNFSFEGQPERVRGARVTGSFFGVLGLPPLHGRAFLPSDQDSSAPPAVLSHDFWRARFAADPSIVGRPLFVDGVSHTVVGVMPAQVRFPPGFSDVWIPLRPNAKAAGRGNHFLSVIARLQPGKSPADARTRLETIAARLSAEFPDSNKDWSAAVTPLAELFARGPRRALSIISVAVFLVLLICCANVACLLLARSASRTREIAVRAALGAARTRLLRQLLSESLVLSLLGGAFGLLLARWGIDALAASLPAALLPMGGLSLNPRVLAFAFAASCFTGILFGLVPAWRGSIADVHSALKEGARTTSASPARARLQSVLVVAEVALAVLLLISAGVLLTSLRRLQQVDLGFNRQGLLTAEISLRSAAPRDTAQFYEQLLARLQAIPGVSAAAAVNWLPMTNDTRRAFAINGVPSDPAQRLGAGFRVASPDYARTLDMRLLRGRFFSEQDSSSALPVVVVNSSFARRFFPEMDPLGRRVALFTSPSELGRWMTVVGVSSDLRHNGPGADPQPELFVPLAQNSIDSMYFAVRAASGDPAALAPAFRATVQSLDPNLPISLLRPMDRLIADHLAPPRFTSAMIGLFALVALLLATLGLFGVISYLIGHRTHEFGVRLALGAASADLLRLVVRRAAVLTGFGVLLGLAGGFAVTRVLRSVLFDDIRPDPVVFLVTAALLFAVAIAASLLPLRRTLRLDPLRALRSE